MRPRSFASLAFAFALSSLSGCAPTVRDPWGHSVARGDEVPAPVVARFQADLAVRPHAPGAAPFAARIYGEASDAKKGPGIAKPLRRYRLDAFGFSSAVVASWSWEDGRWLLVRHDRREAVAGEGEAAIGDLAVRLPDPRIVLGFLSGEPLPGFPGDSVVRVGEDGRVRWRHAGEEWVARLDRATGIVHSASSPSFGLRYSSHRARQGHAIPGEVRVIAGGNTLLTLGVRDWKPFPEWKKDPFGLTVPAGYLRR